LSFSLCFLAYSFKFYAFLYHYPTYTIIYRNEAKKISKIFTGIRTVSGHTDTPGLSFLSKVLILILLCYALNMPQRFIDIFKCTNCGNETLSDEYCNKCHRKDTLIFAYKKELNDNIQDIERLNQLFPGTGYYYYVKPKRPSDPPSYEDKYSVNGIPITKDELHLLYQLGKIRGPLPFEDRQMRPI